LKYAATFDKRIIDQAFVFQDIQKPLDQTLTMIKSAALFARRPLHVHIFTEEDMIQLFKSEVSNCSVSEFSGTLVDTSKTDINWTLPTQKHCINLIYWLYDSIIYFRTHFSSAEGSREQQP